jgi:hypothetical protein
MIFIDFYGSDYFPGWLCQTAGLDKDPNILTHEGL